MAAKSNVPSELIISAKWDKMLERVVLNVSTHYGLRLLRHLAGRLRLGGRAGGVASTDARLFVPIRHEQLWYGDGRRRCLGAVVG